LLLSNALQAMDAPSLNEQLIQAVKNRNIDQATQLLRNGADVNARGHGWTALMLATLGSDIELCKLLIEKGADVNAKNYQGITALATATNIEICKLLIEAGADVNAKNNSKDPILIGSLLGQNPTIEKGLLLIKNGADVNVLDYEGRTPLNLALISLIRKIEKAKELCLLIIDRMLRAPINQVKLPAVELTPEQTSQVNALLRSLKPISLTKLNRDMKKLIVQDFINALKRKNLINFITTQIMRFEFEEPPLRQELLDYLNSRI
jgi:hypothetical protein